MFYESKRSGYSQCWAGSWSLDRDRRSLGDPWIRIMDRRSIFLNLRIGSFFEKIPILILGSGSWIDDPFLKFWDRIVFCKSPILILGSGSWSCQHRLQVEEAQEKSDEARRNRFKTQMLCFLPTRFRRSTSSSIQVLWSWLKTRENRDRNPCHVDS